MTAAKRRPPKPAARRASPPLRRVVLRVPDLRRPDVAADLRRESRALAGDPAEAEALDFIQRSADTRDWR